MNDMTIGFFLGLMVMMVIWIWVANSKHDPQKAKKIIVEHNDGKKETFMGMEWERDNSMLTIFHYDMDKPVVREISLDDIKSIGYANVATGEEVNK